MERAPYAQSRRRGTGMVVLVMVMGIDGCAEDAQRPEAVVAAQQPLTCASIQNQGPIVTIVDDTPIVTDVTDPTKGNTNYGSTQQMNAGHVGAAYQRIVLKFDLSSAGIPPGAVVKSATLTLRVVQSLGKNPIDIYAVSGAWNELTATWNSIAGLPNGGVGALVTSVPTLGTPNNTNVDIALPTNVVANWLDPLANYGLMIDHPMPGRTLIGGSEAPSIGPRPKLSVCYDPPSCADGIQNQGETGLDCGGLCAVCGVAITGAGEAYGHHGSCAGWNGCGDAATCALWACYAAGYASLVSFGSVVQCNDAQACHLFYEPCSQPGGCSVDYDWGAACPVLGVSDIVCTDGGATCSDGVQNHGEMGVDCGGPCAPCGPNVPNPCVPPPVAIPAGAPSCENIAVPQSQLDASAEAAIDALLAQLPSYCPKVSSALPQDAIVEQVAAQLGCDPTGAPQGAASSMGADPSVASQALSSLPCPTPSVGYDNSVAYCGPGTLPYWAYTGQCLNSTCFDHDACYDGCGSSAGDKCSWTARTKECDDALLFACNITCPQCGDCGWRCHAACAIARAMVAKKSGPTYAAGCSAQPVCTSLWPSGCNTCQLTNNLTGHVAQGCKPTFAGTCNGAYSSWCQYNCLLKPDNGQPVCDLGLTSSCDLECYESCKACCQACGCQ